MFLIVGLGNPGAKYAGNRHNAGFMAAEAIAREYRLPAWRKRFRGEVTEGPIAGEKVMLLKPMTFMNESGMSAGEAMRFFNIEGDKVYVIYDELDLAPGKVRIKAGGGAAGHNGIRSLIQHVGPYFMRVRLGIGHPGDKFMVMPHVLSDFRKEDNEWFEPMIEGVAEALPHLLRNEFGTFQNKVHLKVNPPPPKPPRQEIA
jgi:PTH1 family peptidyl-tRNA hydrolase